MNKKIKIAVLETGHILEGSLASGDEWLENIAHRLPPKKYLFQIIVPKIGEWHWQKSGLNAACLRLPALTFDNQANPISIFLAYCLRAWNASQKLKKIESMKIIYSSTDVLPDVLPAYFFKKGHPNVLWLAQIHHLYSSPLTRPGSLLVNLVSYLMQKVSLFCLKNSDFLLVNNSRLASKLLHLGFKRNQMKVLGAGIDYAKICQYKVLPKTKSYQGVYLGRLHATKGVFDLTPIWKTVVKSVPGAKLAIIGDGLPKIKNELDRQIRQNNLAKQIELLGFIPEEKLYSILKKAEVFLFTDREAGWGRAVAEVMACGLPVIGYDIGILGSVYRDGFLKVPLSDHQAFATAVVKLLKNRKRRLKLSKGAQKVAARLDWSKTAKNFDHLLENFLTRPYAAK